MKKSGLADSPFFAAQPKVVATPPSAIEMGNPPIEERVKEQPQSPTPFTTEEIDLQAQNEISQDHKRTFERSNERSMERTNVRPKKQNRERIRHTFDIYKDQLIALQGIQFEKVKAGKKKPKLGKMVSDGIDLYLKQWASKHKQG